MIDQLTIRLLYGYCHVKLITDKGGAKMKNFILATIIALFLAGCSSSGTMTIKTPLNEKIPPGKTAALSVGVDSADKANEDDYKEVLSRIRERLYGKLISEGIFKALVLAPEPADYLLDVKVKGARKVSGVSRVMWGVMAGPNVAELSIRLKNTKTEQIISDFDVEGASATHPFSSESGLDDAIREAVNNIAKGLR